MECTSLILDIRNFTNTFKLFQNIKSNEFIDFIQYVCQLGLDIADLIIDKQDDYYLSSTGDGFLSLIFDKNNHYIGYLFGLLLYHTLKIKCKDFNLKHKTNISFGIGIESGEVEKIIARNSEKNIVTYLGNVINITSRIETETKNHARANLIIGEELNFKLVKDIYNENYREIMGKVKDSDNDFEYNCYLISKMNELNQNLFLSYLFEHNLKGVETPLPLFRLSPTLSKTNKQKFDDLIKTLCGNDDKYNSVKKFIGGINETGSI